MTCDECRQDPCLCQRNLVTPTMWINQTCSTPGCSVIIRSRAGKQASTLPICKWCQSGTAYYREAASPLAKHGGPTMTLDEFGRDLYDAIVLRSSSVMAKNGAQRMRETGHAQEAQEAERSAQRSDAALHALLDRGTIEPDDVRRILSII